VVRDQRLWHLDGTLMEELLPELDLQLVTNLRGVSLEEVDEPDERGNWPVLGCLVDGRVLLIDFNTN
jgi:hypothetical protein